MAVRTVVLDANIYVSALVFGGKPKRAFQLGVTRRIDVAISEPISTEVCARFATSSSGRRNV